MTSLATPRGSSESTPASSRARYVAPTLVGLLTAAALFWGMALLQPRGLEGDADRVDQAWAQLRTLDAPPPVMPPPMHEKPEPAPPPAAANALQPRALTARPPAPTPTAAPRAAALMSRPDLTRIDPLLVGLSPTPDGSHGSGPALNFDPNGTALGGGAEGAGGGLMAGADPRTLDALLALGGRRPYHAPAANANRKPTWLNRIEPEYPRDAQSRNQQGAVMLRLRVGPDGAVREVQVLSVTCTPTPGAETAFSQAATAAAERSSFVPGTDSAGRTAEQWIKVSILFQLH